MAVGGSRVKRQIIDPSRTSSLVLFLLGSIIAGFAAGLGWGLALKIIEKGQNDAAQALRVRRARKALEGRVTSGPMMFVGH